MLSCHLFACPRLVPLAAKPLPPAPLTYFVHRSLGSHIHHIPPDLPGSLPIRASHPLWDRKADLPSWSLWVSHQLSDLVLTREGMRPATLDRPSLMAPLFFVEFGFKPHHKPVPPHLDRLPLVSIHSLTAATEHSGKEHRICDPTVQALPPTRCKTAEACWNLSEHSFCYLENGE